VLAALQHRSPDKTPYHIGFTAPAYAKMAQYYGDPHFAAKLGNCLTAFGTEPSGFGTEPSGGWREVEPDIWEDQFGVRWNRSVDRDIGVVCNRRVTPENIGGFRCPDPDDPSRYAPYRQSIPNREEKFVLVDLGFSLFERAWTLAGMEEVLMAMATDKGFAHCLLDRILEFNLQVIENACACDIDAMMFGDDWGQQRGLIMGARLWREFIKPRIAQMYARVREKGKYVFIHSCGKVDELFPELIECGLHCFNPFQPEVMDVFEMKRRYGRDLSFYGGISTQRTLPYGTVPQVKDEVRRLLEAVGENGGYIASPAHAIPADAKPENIAAMIETLQAQ
jgi:uroporphyrinogen decarboxylase